MSWQDFVRRDGAAKEELRQLPLAFISSYIMADAGRPLTGRSYARSATIQLAQCD